MKKIENGDYVIERDEDLPLALEAGKKEGLSWVYVVSPQGYDGYCVAEECMCTGHIHYND